MGSTLWAGQGSSLCGALDAAEGAMDRGHAASYDRPSRLDASVGPMQKRTSMRILRILRGIVKTALTWAVVWVPVSLIPFGLAALVGSPLPPGVLGPLLITQAVMGAINGGVFASVLAIAGRRKTFETLSLPWIAACGAVGGALFPVAIQAVLFATVHLSIPATADSPSRRRSPTADRGIIIQAREPGRNTGMGCRTTAIPIPLSWTAHR